MSDENVPTEDAVEVNPAAFEEMMTSGAAAPPTDPGLMNLDLLLDVTVPVTVCVGTIRKRISEILSMTPGSVMDLNRYAGDPVDLLVNGKLIARGEVVVVDDRYGLRITEIVSTADRLSATSAG